MLDVAESRYRLAPLFWAAIVFVVLAPAFWYNTMLPPGSDIARAPENAYLYESVYPSGHYAFERMRSGSLPLWNPTQWCGVPHLVRPSISIFQPLNAVFLFLNTGEAFAVQGFLCLFLAGTFFVLFARALGVGFLPGIFGGIAYAFGGATAAGISRPEIAAALAWTPLLFWAITEYPRRCRAGVSILGGIAGAGLLLSGSPPMIFCVSALALPYSLLRTLPRGAQSPPLDRAKGARGLLTMAGLAVCLSAVQWVPTVFWLRELADGWGVLLRFDLAGRSAATLNDMFRQLLVAEPELLPHIGYFGIGALMTAPLALVNKASRREGIFFIATGIVFYVVTMLGSGHDAFPFAALNFPGQFSLAIAASLGLNAVFVRSAEGRRTSIRGPFSLLLGLSVVIIVFAPTITLWRVVIFMSFLGTYAIFRTPRAGAICSFCVIVFSFLDLSGASVNAYRHPFFDADRIRATHGALLENLGEIPGRVFISPTASAVGVPANSGMLGGMRVAGGSYLPLTEAQALWGTALEENDMDQQGEEDVRGRRLLDYMAVDAVVEAKRKRTLAGSGLEPEGNGLESLQELITIEQHPSALPRAYWTPKLRPFENVQDSIAMLHTADFEGRRETAVIVTETNTEWATGAENALSIADAVVEILTDHPEYIELRVDVPANGITVLSDSFAPGWQATLNGEAVPILVANGLFRGVITPAGKHTITFTYKPIPFYIGLAVSVGTLAILLLIGIVALATRSPSTQRAQGE